MTGGNPQDTYKKKKKKIRKKNKNIWVRYWEQNK